MKANVNESGKGIFKRKLAAFVQRNFQGTLQIESSEVICGA